MFAFSYWENINLSHKASNTQLSPSNIIDRKSFQLKTPDVIVKVDPAKLDVVETRIIDGTKYILIRADNDVEVNGVNIKIKK